MTSTCRNGQRAAGQRRAPNTYLFGRSSSRKPPLLWHGVCACYVYVCMYLYVCMCVCVCRTRTQSHRGYYSILGVLANDHHAISTFRNLLPSTAQDFGRGAHCQIYGIVVVISGGGFRGKKREMKWRNCTGTSLFVFEVARIYTPRMSHID